MGRGLPSMTALLALLAVAGYQNRDKIAEILGGTRRSMEPTIKAAWEPFWVSWGLAARAPVESSAVGSVNSWSASSKADAGETAEFLGQHRAQRTLHCGRSSSGRSGLRSWIA